MEQARSRLAARTNDTLARLERAERVDHRSYARRGIDRAPTTHFGPSAAHRVHRGEPHERLDLAVTVASEQDRIEAIDATIAVLEAERRA